ncbi:MAG: cytochrome c [Pseudomonadota bacterium]|nr:cytochrome c [Sphingomonas sp. 3F27F9]
MRHHLPSLSFTGASIALLLLATAAFVYFGIYNIAADAPHTPAVYSLLESLRDRSIAVHAHGITPPADLNAPQRIAAGAGLYAEMCSSCHLGPGVERSELSQGLYPQAPELAKPQDLSAGEQFWIIKHGVKLSAMPAWGKTHPDPLIWDMVAFVRRLPGMSPEEYKRLVASAPEDHDEMMKDMPGMK